MSAGTKIGRKGEALIAALLTEPTQAVAGEKAGVSESTVQRWLRVPRFRAAYRAARTSVVEVAVGRLQQVTGEAVDALRRNLTSGNPSVEVKAAACILDQSLRAVELIDLVARLEELERELQSKGAPDPSAWGAKSEERRNGP